MTTIQDVLNNLEPYRGMHGLYIITPKNPNVLKEICLKLNYSFKSEIAYVGKGAKTKSSDLRNRAKQEMGWSNFEGATFVRKMGIFLGFDVTDKTNAQLKEQSRKFICDNFNIQCIEHPLEDDLLFHEKELIRKLQPCLNDKKNK